MLNKIKNQENIIMMFFIIMLCGVVCYVVVDKNVIDILYLVVLLFYFVRFLILKYGR